MIRNREICIWIGKEPDGFIHVLVITLHMEMDTDCFFQTGISRLTEESLFRKPTVL